MISSVVKPKFVLLVNTPMGPCSELAPGDGVISGIVSWGYMRSNMVQTPKEDLFHIILIHKSFILVRLSFSSFHYMSLFLSVHRYSFYHFCFLFLFSIFNT